MKMPFTVDQFFEVFRHYNETLWPAQVFLSILAVIVVVLVFRARPWTGRVVSAILGFLWFWLALAYHLAFFSRINPLAYGFSLVSLIGAFVLLWQGVIRRRLEFEFRLGAWPILGAALVLYALAVYPLWSVYSGHPYPAMPTFGLPCPTTLFTIGILAFARPVYPRSPLIVPALWCLIGGQAAFSLSVQPDYGLFAAFLVAVGLLVRRQHGTVPVE
jgi:hypothetical protein